MKKYIFFILTALFFSCDKDKGCYDCTTTFNISVVGPTGSDSYSTTDTQSICGESEEWIRNHETSNSKTIVEENNGYTKTTVITVSCIK